MKKIVFCLNNLDYGGIEKAFINLCNEIDYTKYDVTVILEHKEGVFLDRLNKKIKVIDYHVSDSKNVIKRKITNRLKLIKFIIANYHKYDFACSYATGRIVGSILSRYLSSNNALYIHGNIFDTKEDQRNFFKKIKVLKFKKLVFVSNSLRRKYVKLVPNNKQEIFISNNIIDYQNIIKLSEEYKIEKDKLTLVHIGRHREVEKNIYMLLDIIWQLKKDGYDFLVYLIGDGEDHQAYIEKAKELEIDDKIVFTGSLENPYPYLKIADALLLTSVKEGNPVVFLEAMVLNVPIITTYVSDSKDMIKDKYGMVCNLGDYYLTLREFMNYGFKIKKKFDYKKYNQEILENLDRIIGEDNESKCNSTSL